MHSKILILLSGICILVFASCKKKQSNEDTKPIEYSNFSALKQGNYWIYESHAVDELGHDTLLGYDSICIDGMNYYKGNTYYFKKVFEGNSGVPEIFVYRDSLHYLVDQFGNRFFSSLDFQQVLQTHYLVIGGDSFSKTSVYMSGQHVPGTYPAGTIYTHDVCSDIQYFPKYSADYPNRKLYTKYAENIGMVYESWMFAGSKVAFNYRTLLRYHLE